MTNKSQLLFSDDIDIQAFRRVDTPMPTSNQAVVVTSIPNISEQEIINLGAKQLSNISDVSNAILSNATTGDVDILGQKLNQLVTTTKQLDPTKIGKKSWFEKLFSAGESIKDKALAQYQTVEQRINQLILELDAIVKQMSSRIDQLDQMYNDNHAKYYSLAQVISRGQAICDQMNNYHKSRDQPTDGIQAIEYNDYQQKIDRLEQRLDDLKRGQLLIQQSLPEIRIEQNNKRSLIGSISTIEITLIPTWKSVFSRYILSMETKKGAEVIAEVYDAADQALRLNADLVRQNSVAVAKQQQRSIVSTGTLVYCQEQLISAINDTMEIVKQGKAERAAARPELEKLEKQLINRFTNK